jgi:hypothetical protein
LTRSGPRGVLFAFAVAGILATLLASSSAEGQQRDRSAPDSAAARGSLLAGAEAGKLAARRWEVGWYAIGGFVGGFAAGVNATAFAVPNYPSPDRPKYFVVSATWVGLMALLGRHADDVVLPDSLRRNLAEHAPAYREGFEDAYRRELPPRRRRVLLRAGLIGAAGGAAMWVLLAAFNPWT